MDEQEAGKDGSQEELEKEPSESTTAAEGSEAAPSDDEARDPQEGQSGDTLAWLEGPAFGAPIDEQPTLQWSDVEAEADAGDGKQELPDSIPSAANVEAADGESDQPPDDLEDAMLWLENLAKEQGTPIDEMPTLVSSGEPEPDPLASAAAVRSLKQGSETQPPDLDSDPMAWLEQLAIDQSSPLEELPSIADRLLASEIASQFDADLEDVSQLEPLASQPVELDDALKYLENQAEEQGISLDEVSFDQAEPVELSDEDLNALDQLLVAPIAAAAVEGETDTPAAENENGEWDDLSAQIPEDPDEALVWLGELAGEEDSSDTGSEKSVLAKGAAAVAVAGLVQSDDQPLDAEILEGMPDDPDEAMAWMEGLAGQNEEEPADQMVSETPDERERPTGEFPEDTGLAQHVVFLEARDALSSGDAGSATEQYRKLLDGGQGGPELINELETAVASQPEEPELAQLLGDAYMQDGQLQKALKIYRKGFDQL